MASHQQLLYHVIFSTKERRPLLQDDDFRESVWSYMAGVVNRLGGHAVRIGGHYDHAHLLVRIPAKLAVADFVGKAKANTSKYINEQRQATLKFHWQDGYGAFTVSRTMVDPLIRYIDSQIAHHQKWSFQDEFLQMLAEHGVDFNPKYVWE